MADSSDRPYPWLEFLVSMTGSIVIGIASAHNEELHPKLVSATENIDLFFFSAAASFLSSIAFIVVRFNYADSARAKVIHGWIRRRTIRSDDLKSRWAAMRLSGLLLACGLPLLATAAVGRISPTLAWRMTIGCTLVSLLTFFVANERDWHSHFDNRPLDFNSSHAATGLVVVLQIVSAAFICVFFFLPNDLRENCWTVFAFAATMFIGSAAAFLVWRRI